MCAWEVDADEEIRASSLGLIALAVECLSRYLAVPLRYQTRLLGSRSVIRDETEKDSGKFPLYSRNMDQMRFRTAVRMLNKNVELLLQSQNVPIAENDPLTNLYRLFVHDQMDRYAGVLLLPLLPVRCRLGLGKLFVSAGKARQLTGSRVT